MLRYGYIEAAPAGTRRQSGGLGDGEASVKNRVKELDTVLKKKNPPPVVIVAAEGAPAARIELTIAEYDEEAPEEDVPADA